MILDQTNLKMEKKNKKKKNWKLSPSNWNEDLEKIDTPNRNIRHGR